METTAGVQCPKCGTLSGSAEVCDACGALISRIRDRGAGPPPPLEEPELRRPQPRTSGESAPITRIATWLAGIAAIGLLMVAILRGNQSDSPNVVHLTSATFADKVLKAPADHAWVIDLWAPWCGPCRSFGPEFATTADMMAHRASFGKVNVDEARDIAAQFNISGIPTVLLIKDGAVVDQFAGAMSRSQFQSWLDERL